MIWELEAKIIVTTIVFKDMHKSLCQVLLIADPVNKRG